MKNRDGQTWLLTTLSLTLIALTLTSRGAFACINDRDSDTLAIQGQQLPDVVRVISGRFERNPPLYFQMRIARVAAELQKHPERLALYDDIAVAHDRLGQQNQAIAWMNRKRAQMAQSSTRSSADDKEALYRFYANNGTFWAHRWLQSGANRSRIGEMKTARDMIAQAIKIKPNAHFGREKYQLMTMNWILNPRVKGSDGKFFTPPLSEYFFHHQTFKTSSQPERISGLSGIIVLGNAWESVDIFESLSRALANDKKSTLQYLAILRCRELIDAGKKSLHSNGKTGFALQQHLRIDAQSLDSAKGLVTGTNLDGLMVNEQNQAAIETVYKRLRAEAENWQNTRTSYMMSRLKTGRHPDTDKTFWNEWRDSSPPSLDVAWYSERAAQAENREKKNVAGLFLAFVPLFLVLAGTLIFVRRKRLRL